MNHPELNMAKQELREYMLDLREQLDPETKFHAVNMLSELLSEVILEVNPRVVAFYFPIKSEIDITPLAETVSREFGMGVALPRVVSEGTPLTFNLWDIEEGQLTKDIKGIPCSDNHEVSPDLILVPLLAFDQQGNRLGYGEGYYDRTLAEYPESVKVGVGYSFQQVEYLDADEHDVKMHAIVTEKELLYCEDLEGED